MCQRRVVFVFACYRCCCYCCWPHPNGGSMELRQQIVRMPRPPLLLLPLLKGGPSLVMFCVFSVRFRFLSLPRVAASCVFYSRRLTRINNTSLVIYVPEDIVFIFHATRSDSRLELGPELPPPPPPAPVSCPRLAAPAMVPLLKL